MQSLLKYLVAATVAVVNFAFGCEPGTADCTIEKSDWIRKMEAGLITAFCEKSSPFTRCYAVTAPQCTALARELTRQCLSEADIPDHFERTESRKFGEALGACVGDRFTDREKLRKGKSESCLVEGVGTK